MSMRTGLDKQQLLMGHFLFQQLLPAEIDRILALTVERTFRDGQSVFVKGEEGSSMMIVLDGKVAISALSEDGKEITLNTIEPGGVLGEIALLDNRPRSANATAVGATTLLYIQRSEFIPFLRQNPDVAIQLLMMLCEKLRATSDMVENVSLLPVPARLARLILKLAQAEQATPQSEVSFQLNLSQTAMGNLIGATRETVNRTLAQWQTDGLIALEGKQLAILKPKQLSLLCDGAH